MTTQETSIAQDSASSRRGLIWPWLVTFAILGVLSPLLSEHFGILWGRVHYRWCAILVVWVVVSLWLQWRQAEKPERVAPTWISVIGYLAVFIQIGVAYLYFTGWVAIVAAICTVGLLVLHLSRQRRMQHAFGTWALLFLLVRLPNQLEGRLLRVYEDLSARIGSAILEWRGVYHVSQANEMVLDAAVVDIRIICNGFYSIYMMVFMAALFVVWKQRPLLYALCVLASSTLVAAVVNGIRVAVVCMITNVSGVNIMETGWLWLMLAVSLALSFLLLLSFDAFFGFFFAEVEEERAKKNLLVRVWNGLCHFGARSLTKIFKVKGVEASGGRWLPVAVFSGLLVMAGFAGSILYYEWTAEGEGRTKFMHSRDELKVIDQESITFERPGWQVLEKTYEEREFASIWGQFSLIWKLKYEDLFVIVALDYPFDKWHDVKVCYSNEGWKIDEERLTDLPSYNGWGASETEMSLPTGDYGFIMCSHLSHIGEPVQAKPTAHQFDMVLYYLHPKQWKAPYGTSVNKDKNTFYQCQVMVRSSFPLSEEQREEVRQMYGDFRNQVKQQIEQMPTP
ncbi:hypothetical protein Rhal01_01373 [Rubritalea halochordaticola]|uniref:Exosortase/archaeosortase family protein n=1 Tax=Rubritalea halochordaticola TaxID=714537 RepID=A0ABP9UXL5_9BACT